MRVIALLILVCAALLGQEPDFRINVQFVRLLVSVKNAAGESVGSLDKRDFTVFDKDVPQEITLFEHQTTQPLSVALLVDSSPSTARDTRSGTAAILKFANALFQEGNPDDAASLYSFDSEVTLLNSFTRRLSRIEDNLRGMKRELGTSLYDAVYLASQSLSNREGRHVIVALSDGGDTTSRIKYAAAVAAAQKADVVLYPIVLVPIASSSGRNIGGEHALETMAAATGGRTFYPSAEADLDRSFTDILRELRTQYLIGYYPRGPAAGDGKFHRVRLELPQRPDLRISTRAGYYGVVSR